MNHDKREEFVRENGVRSTTCYADGQPGGEGCALLIKAGTDAHTQGGKKKFTGDDVPHVSCGLDANVVQPRTRGRRRLKILLIFPLSAQQIPEQSDQLPER